VSGDAEALFKMYSLGVVTNRDIYAYSFNLDQLRSRANTFIDVYNSTVDKARRLGHQVNISALVDNDDPRIKWTRQVKVSLSKMQDTQFNEAYFRKCLYRPFTKKFLYFDEFWNEEQYKQPLLFPIQETENENVVICLTTLGSEKPFMALATNVLTDLHLVGSGSGNQCFSYYVYSRDGTNRRENITDWALKQFQEKYGPEVTKWDIFHYVYGLLHHPQYRERYAENLKRDLPHIPLVHNQDAFSACVNVGQQLMDLHLNYETVKEYPLTWLENENVPFSWRVEKMRLSTDRRVVVVNESLRLGPLPQECFQYRLGNRSALEWVIDQYQVSKDSRSGIESDPNRLDDEEYIVRLVCRVVQVSVETVCLVNELAQKVTVADWTTEHVNISEDATVQLGALHE
jgi:predicted helicase